jgi:signal transduction histidine kinase
MSLKSGTICTYQVTPHFASPHKGITLAMQILAQESKNYFLRFIIVAAASAAASWFGFLLLPAGSSATLIWPPSAVGIAVLFLYGYELWPAIMLSILGTLLFRNLNLPLDIGISIADTFEAFLGAYFLRIYVEFNPMLARLRDSLGLLVACIAPTLVAAIVITSTSFMLGRTPLMALESMFAAVWIGHAVSALSFTPFLIRWLYRPLFYKTPNEVYEGVLIFGSVTICSYLLFWTSYGSLGSVSLVYIILLPLIWAALRSGPRGTTFALAIMSAIGTSGILYGHSPLSQGHNPQSVFLLQVLLGALDIIFLLFTSIVEERKEAVVMLQANVGQLEAAIEKIRMEDQAKTNFLAILAHELRNPLSPILSSVEIMKIDEGKVTDPALVDTIETHARTMSLLLDDLLDISRITQNKFELRREYLQLPALVKHSVTTVEPFLKTCGHTLDVSVPKEDLYLYGDPVRIEQILINLLNNSGKYTDPGGHISIACIREGRYAAIRVTDNGIGIAKDRLAGVFEAFGQQGRPTRQPGGLGIGLSLTRQLVELHGGTIEADSRGSGKGSTFTVRLPLNTETFTGPSEVARNIVNRLRGKSSEPQRILVVDDNAPAAKGLTSLLGKRGHLTEMALSGQEALDKILTFKPDVVILDIGLPDMSGYEVAEKIKNTPLRPKRLIALTGYGQDDDKAKSKEAGFDAHLIKPVSLAHVEDIL